MTSASFIPFLQPSRLWSRDEIFSSPCPIEKRSGVYAWYFDECPPHIQTEACHCFQGLTLLYVGTSPTSPPRNGKPPSRQTIFDRIRYHYSGNAEGSTLRLTLGCLLSEKLSIQLRRVGSGKRMTFGDGERVLSEWMRQHALVTWVYHTEPWVLEEELITKLYLPLNLLKNEHNPNHAIVSSIHAQARKTARELPVLVGPC